MKLKKKQKNSDLNPPSVKSSSDKNKDIKHVKLTIPICFDMQEKRFLDEDGRYIGMVGLEGTNLHSFKTEDQNSYIRALAQTIASVKNAQIYACEVPADIDGYVEDIERLQKQLNIIENKKDKLKWTILEEYKIDLSSMALAQNLIDKKYVIIVKNKDLHQLDETLRGVAQSLYSFSNAKVLPIKEVTEVLYNYYRPGDHDYFNSFYKPSMKDNIMDLLYPDEIYLVGNVKPAIYIDGYYTKNKYISKWVDKPSFAFLSFLANQEGIEFSLHFELDEDAAMKDQLDKNAKNLNTQFNNAKVESEKKKLQESYNDNNDLLDDIVREIATPLYMMVTLRYKATSLTKLKEIEQEVDKLLKNNGVIVRDAAFMPLEMMNSVAPIGYTTTRLDSFINQTTAQTIGYMYPFCFESLYDSQPLYDVFNNLIGFMPPIFIGNTVSSGGPIFYDNHTKNGADRVAFSEIITGTTGMGKTTFLMYLVMLRYALGYKQYIIDIEGKELNKLTTYLYGVNIDCSSSKNGKNTINPLQVRIIRKESEDVDEIVPLDKTYPLDAHIRFLEDFLTMYAGNTKNVDFEAIGLIKEAFFDEYEKRGMTSDTTAQEFIDKFKNEDYPLFSDIYDHLFEMQIKAKEEQNKVRVEYLEKAIIFMRSLAKGEDASIFNASTNIDLEQDLTCFNLSNLFSNGVASRVLNAQYYNTLTFIWSNVSSVNENRIRQQIYADEQHTMIDPVYPNVLKFFETLVRRSRKYICGLTSASQEIEDYYKESVRESASVIFKQSTYKFFFGNGGNDTKMLSELANVPESEIEFIKYATQGECYMKVGAQTALQASIIIPPYFLDILETLKKEVKAQHEE